MGLDIQIMSVPRAMASQAADASIGSRYDKKPRWRQVAYDRDNWVLFKTLDRLYRQRGGARDSFNDTAVRLYKHDLHIFRPSIAAQVIEHMKKGRVVYAEASW